MAGVKSFRIDDLLAEKHEKEEKNQGSQNLKEKCTRADTLSQEEESNSSSDDSNSSSLKSDQKRDILPRILLREKLVAGHRETKGRGERFGVGGSLSIIPPYNPNLPSGSPSYGYESSSKPISYYLPYGLGLKFNQHPHGLPSSHIHGVPNGHPFSLASAVQSGFLPPRAELAAYHGMLGHVMAKQAGVGHSLPDKRQFVPGKLHYPLYSLTRPLYTSTCKRKGGQIRFNTTQTVQLEKAFVQQKYLNAHDRKKLAHSLGLSDRQVKTWFQNRRAKLRKCKGNETEESGLPQDLRTVRHLQHENPLYEGTPGAKTG